MIDIASGVSSLEKVPGHGDAMIVSLSRLNNHRDSFFQNKFKNNKPKLNTNERRCIPVTEFTDNKIRAYPRQPLRQLTSPTRMAVAMRGDPCSIVNYFEGKVSYQWLFYPVIEQGVAQ